MPGAADRPLTLLVDNLEYRSRLRREQPESEEAMNEQRRGCVEVILLACTARCRIAAETRVCSEWPGSVLVRRGLFQLEFTWQPMLGCFMSVSPSRSALIHHRDTLQKGLAAIAARKLGTAMYWFKLVRMWAPADFLRAEVDLCVAARAVARPPVRLTPALLRSGQTEQCSQPADAMLRQMRKCALAVTPLNLCSCQTHMPPCQHCGLIALLPVGHPA